jgi:putative tryptophan/tyrosine transport system substrate-binding protein
MKKPRRLRLPNSYSGNLKSKIEKQPRRLKWALGIIHFVITFAYCGVVGAQPTKVARIGYMSIPSRQSAEDLIQIFLQELREHGWVERQNLFIEWRWAEGKIERLPNFAAELVRLNVDLIVAPQTPSALAAKKATRTIPIVFMFPWDPVAEGVVASLAHPGGNATGLTLTPTLEIFGKQLELLKETIPKAARVTVLWNSSRAAVQAPALSEVKRAGRSLGLDCRSLGYKGQRSLIECSSR